MQLWESIIYSIVSGIYSTVGWVYDIMLNLLYDGSKFAYDFGESVLTTLYVLAGIFMLFRIVISMITMILNPDQVTDKKVGTGKLLTRIVVVIVLLLLFMPSGYLLGGGDDEGNGAGLLKRLESAIIGTKTEGQEGEPTNGLLSKLFQTGNIQKPVDEKSGSILIGDVFADTKWTKTCYYYKGVDFSQSVNGEAKSGQYNKNYYKVQYSNEPSAGAMLIDGRNSSANIYIKFIPGPDSKITDSNGKAVNFKDPGVSNFKQVKLDMFDLQWRPSLQYKKISNCNNWTLKKKDGQLSLIYNKNAVAGGGHWFGANSAKEFVKVIEGNLKNLGTVEGMDDLGTGLKKNTNLRFEHDESQEFATTAMSSFQTCTSDNQEDINDCEELKSKQLGDVSASNDVVTMMNDGDMKLDFLTAVIAGIGLIIFIVVLCVDVVVRQLKLALLGAMAPIPIVSYADPNDKIFMNWVKMYVNVYVSLFIQLIAIKFAVVLLAELSSSGIREDITGLENFFYIIGILIFAKAVPTIISKIFNLDLGSSFKDIGNMVKAGAGFAAGAAIGGAVGAATGQGFGRLTGAARGMMMGAGSGAKGKVLGGAQGIAAKNATINQQKADGFNFMDRAAIAMANAVGYSPKAKMDTDIKDMVDKKSMLDNFRKHKDNIESMADSSNYMSDLKVKMENGQIGKEEYKAERSNFIELNERNRKNAAGNIEWFDSNSNQWVDSGQSSNYVDSNGNISSIKFEKSSKGKIEQAEAEMRAEFNASSALRDELGMQGQQITNFASYESAEAKAKDNSNAYSTKIIEVQKSDEYARAEAFEKAKKS